MPSNTYSKGKPRGQNNNNNNDHQGGGGGQSLPQHIHRQGGGGGYQQGHAAPQYHQQPHQHYHNDPAVMSAVPRSQQQQPNYQQAGGGINLQAALNQGVRHLNNQPQGVSQQHVQDQLSQLQGMGINAGGGGGRGRGGGGYRGGSGGYRDNQGSGGGYRDSRDNQGSGGGYRGGRGNQGGGNYGRDYNNQGGYNNQQGGYGQQGGYNNQQPNASYGGGRGGGGYRGRGGRGGQFDDGNQQQGGRGGGGGGGGGLTKEQTKHFDNLITAFLADDSMTELVFPSTLSPKERHHLHKLAMHYGLDHKSTGEGVDRKLKITKVGGSGNDQAARKANANQTQETVNEAGETITQRIKVIDGFQGVQPLGDAYLADNHAKITERAEPLMNSMLKIMSEFLKKPPPRKNFRADHRNTKMAPPPPKDSDEKVEKLKAFRTSLPAYKQGPELLQMVKDNRVVVVSGDTGCGKTTQIPQMLMDSGMFPKNQSIICTQPRRISALSVAQRVAEERGESCGASTGYVIRFENVTSRDTRLMYVTTGILLRRLHSDPELKDISCVVLDEVHERDVDTDFTLLLLRDILVKNSHVKVVVMSATIQVDRLVAYFTKANGHAPPPLCSIPGRLFPVREYFLEDARAWMKGMKSGDESGGSPVTEAPAIAATGDNDSGAVQTEDFAKIRAAAQQKADKDAEAVVPYDVLVSVVERYHMDHRDDFSGSILVFLPGWGPIDRTMNLLRNSRFGREYSVLPLHSSLTSAEQARVFYPPPKRFRKIVLATNVAETSITIDDVTCVIDSGLHKGTSYEPMGNTSSLTSQLIAKANGLQRKGRAGRCKPGVCVHLLARSVYEGLPAFLEPEINRTPLEEICLQIKAVLPDEKCVDVLSRALDAPDRASIEHAVEFLTELGALDPRERLTNLGRVLAMLPIHPILGKMLLIATSLGVLEPIAIIAASLSAKSPFVKPLPHQVAEVKGAIQYFARGQMSDHMAVLNLFQEWKEADRPQDFAQSHWADGYTLRGIDRTKAQLERLIMQSGFLSHVEGNSANYASRHRRNDDLIKFCLLWSLYPRVACVEYSRKMRSKADVFCWDNKPAVFSLGSVAGKARRSDFSEREPAVYFERMKIEAQLSVFDMTSVTRTALILSVRHLRAVHLAEYPAVLLADDESKFSSWTKFSLNRMVKEAALDKGIPIPDTTPTDLPHPDAEAEPVDDSPPKAVPWTVLEVDRGKKAFVATAEEVHALQTLKEVLEFFFALAVQKVDASRLPEELVEALSVALGNPTSSEPAAFDTADSGAARGGPAATTGAGVGGSHIAGHQPSWMGAGESAKKPKGGDEESEEEPEVEIEDADLGTEAFDSQMLRGHSSLIQSVTTDEKVLDRLYEGFGDLSWFRRQHDDKSAPEDAVESAAVAASIPANAPTAASVVAGGKEVVSIPPLSPAPDDEEDDDDDDDEIVFQPIRDDE